MSPKTKAITFYLITLIITGALIYRFFELDIQICEGKGCWEDWKYRNIWLHIAFALANIIPLVVGLWIFIEGSIAIVRRLTKGLKNM